MTAILVIVSDWTGSFEVNIISLRMCTEILVSFFVEDVISLQVLSWDNLVSLAYVHCNSGDNF